MDMEEISAAYKNLSKQNENLKVIHVLHEYWPYKVNKRWPIKIVELKA
jgi:hypothetical protein